MMPLLKIDLWRRQTGITSINISQSFITYQGSTRRLYKAQSVKIQPLTVERSRKVQKQTTLMQTNCKN